MKKLLILAAAVASLSACSKRVLVSVETGQKKVVRPNFWSDHMVHGDTVSTRKGELYVVKY
jgi:hypothetical protein